MRLSESFENRSKCKDRSQKNKTRNHIGSVSWDSSECLKEVSSYGAEMNKINFSALAKKFGMKNNAGNYPGNGGQVVK